MSERDSLFTFRGRRWWRGRLWCPGCDGKHWLWRTLVRCDGGVTFVEYALLIAVLSITAVVVLVLVKA